MANSRKSSAFDYKPQSYDEATTFTQKNTSTYDSIIKSSGPSWFKPRQGDNTIRILPPTWENARHYSYEVWVHNDIGPDKGQYLCLKQNETAPEHNCPLCEERHSPKINPKEIELLRARPRNYIYLIDRYTEEAGVLVWSISNQSDKEILSQSLIKKTQQYLPIAHPLDGYDIEFSRDGQGIKTRYNGFKVSRDSSPVSPDRDTLEEWIDFIDNNPIPEILNFFPASHIRDVYYGRRQSDDYEPVTTTSRSRVAAVDEDTPPFDIDEKETTPAPRRRPPIGGMEDRDALRRRIKSERDQED
jgi:hypothetical protein